ncbi:MAG TPA: hypothetical protein VJ485_00535 [archaeon]|nr:hypothetical protein [archaeon]
MIGGIDGKADTFLYLDSEEMQRLPDETIEGVLVKIHKPKRQGTVYLSVDDSRKNENGPNGIGVDDKGYWGVQDGFCVRFFMGTEWHRELQKKGRIGTRLRMRDGSEIHVYDRSRLDGMDAGAAEYLEFYRDNKERLPEDFA